ncbi:MAG: hypothetical protein ACYCX2_06085 [Christensenellales bacterium]
MKRVTCWILVLLLIAVLAGCAGTQGGGQTKAPVSSATPAGTGAPSETNAPNVWRVTKDAPVMDAATGKQAGTAFAGFAVSIENVSGNKASFEMALLDDKGENVKETRTYTIDTSYMELTYVEPQAVIMIISLDMIELKPNAILYNDKGEKLLSFTDAVGPFRFIQLSDKGYMFTIDFNVVFVKESDATFIKVS